MQTQGGSLLGRPRTQIITPFNEFRGKIIKRTLFISFSIKTTLAGALRPALTYKSRIRRTSLRIWLFWCDIKETRKSSSSCRLISLKRVESNLCHANRCTVWIREIRRPEWDRYVTMVADYRVGLIGLGRNKELAEEESVLKPDCSIRSGIRIILTGRPGSLPFRNSSATIKIQFPGSCLN